MKIIKNGYDGDGPENDIEAVLEAIERNPDAKEIVLIADISPPIKDISLLKKINKPVRVILCGTIAGVNVQLARSTGGFVQTMEKDLTNIAEMSEGKTFELSGKFFKIVGEIVVEYIRTYKSLMIRKISRILHRLWSTNN